MVTYLGSNQIFSVNKSTEPQILLHELQRIRQTVIYEGKKFY